MVHHRSENGGAEPTVAEIENWYRQKPLSYLAEKLERAYNWYRGFAWSLLDEDIEEEKQKAAESALLAEVRESRSALVAEVKDLRSAVKKAGAFRNQIWVGLVAAAIGPILLGLLVVGARALDLWPTPTQVQNAIEHNGHS